MQTLAGDGLDSKLEEVKYHLLHNHETVPWASFSASLSIRRRLRYHLLPVFAVGTGTTSYVLMAHIMCSVKHL